VTRKPRKTLTAVLALGAALGLTPGCRRTEEARTAQAPAAVPQVPVEPAGPPSPEVQAAVQGILDTGQHPLLSWPDVTGVLPALRTLYAAEPDGLFWFAGESAHPALAEAVHTLVHADTYGLDPGDYDAPRMAEKWEAATAGAAYSPTQRALFDVALTVATMRLLSSLHEGRVDPRLVGFDYDVSAKRLDLAATLRSTRDAGGLPAAIASAEPHFPVYRRLVKAFADYRALAAAGEPAPVPALAAPRKKVERGQPWAGVGTPAQSLFTRARRDFSHGCIRLEDPARLAEWPTWTRRGSCTSPTTTTDTTRSSRRPCVTATPTRARAEGTWMLRIVGRKKQEKMR
jgi:murein L,D-transpeptidase YcbB/YkuD